MEVDLEGGVMKRVDTYDQPFIVEYMKRTKDENICTLIALHCVTGVSLEDCNTYLKKFGRTYRRGMLRSEIEESLKNTKKFYFKEGDYSETNRITLKRFIEKHPKGRYYVLVRGHALAIIDGVIFDHCDKPRRQITKAWRCYTQDEVEKLRGEPNDETSTRA